MKTVVIVEDQDDQRVPLQKALERRGFRVGVAATVAEAYRVIEELGEETDVMVLDMALEDPDAHNTTGAEIAIEVRNQHPEWMPEYLIITGHPGVVNFYRLALRLGVAAYFAKNEVIKDDVIRHIRVLALKRSLRFDRPKVMDALNSISKSTKNLSDAVKKFCREMLAESLKDCLGIPYILLLTDERGTQNVATNTDLLPGYGSFYAVLQELAHGVTKLTSPYVVSKQDLEGLPAPANANEEQVLARLSGAALVPLADFMNYRLSLALFVSRPEEFKFPENVEQMAAVLTQHVRPNIVENFLSILVHLYSQKRAVLKSISYLCLYVGQEQQRMIEQGVNRRDLQEESETHQSLKTMADDLWQTGTILNSAANIPAPVSFPTLEMKKLIESEFAELRDVDVLNELKLTVEGSCRVSAENDLDIAVRCLLQWLAQRRTDTPPTLKPEIRVRCLETEEDSLIIFEDRSRRLSEKLRQHLFEPFSTSLNLAAGASKSGPGLYLPLYLAQVLVEEKYGGRLDDESNKMEGDIGHRLVMRFRPPGEPLITNNAPDDV